MMMMDYLTQGLILFLPAPHVSKQSPVIGSQVRDDERVAHGPGGEHAI